MAASERSLWPQDLFTTVETQRTPLALLREQATLLGEKTKNLVEAKVTTDTEPLWAYFREGVSSFKNPDLSNRCFVQTFKLVSTALGNYTYELFRLVHPIEGYPLKVFFQDSEQLVKSEEELIDVLKAIFANEKTRRVIQAMIAQSQS